MESLKSFYRFLAIEGMLAENPVRHLHAPHMYWHTSSHIGDDYIISHNLTPDQLSKHVTDDVRVYADYALCEHLRVYGGASYSFNM